MIREAYTPKKLFSLKEANGTLPLVSRIVEDVVSVSQKILAGEKQARGLAGAGRHAQAEEAREAVDQLVEQLKEFVKELEVVGCSLKDFQQGLVDFPARLEGRIVFLCWKLGEPEIRHWHEVQTGFAGRQAVAGIFAS